MDTRVIWDANGDTVPAEVLHRSGSKVVVRWTHPVTTFKHTGLLHEPTGFLLAWCDSEGEAVERLRALEEWDDSRSDPTLVVADAPPWVKGLCDKWRGE